MASVPYEYECDKSAGFLPDPNEHKRVGYLTSLAGFGMNAQLVFKADLTVFTPWNNGKDNINAKFGGLSSSTAPTDYSQKKLGKMQVVGVLEKIAWNGGVGDAITLDDRGLDASEHVVWTGPVQRYTRTSTAR